MGAIILYFDNFYCLILSDNIICHLFVIRHYYYNLLKYIEVTAKLQQWKLCITPHLMKWYWKTKGYWNSKFRARYNTRSVHVHLHLNIQSNLWIKGHLRERQILVFIDKWALFGVFFLFHLINEGWVWPLFTGWSLLGGGL